MSKTRRAATFILLIFAVGCAGKRININPSNPVYKPKSDFELNYGFFISPDERKLGYTLEDFPKLSEPIKPFDKIDTLNEFRRFEKHFWDIRDTDPNTPENEFKELIDSRLEDIKNEIFVTDLEIPGTSFGTNGGLTGDLARVYLLRGAPLTGDKEKLREGYYHKELMIWYYDGAGDRPLFRFLFYNDLGRRLLFREYLPIISYDYLFDPAISPLRTISSRLVFTSQDLLNVWYELERDDPAWLFRSALFEFSPYFDWVIEGGNNKTKFGALDPPEPSALTAERFKPVILGQPDVPEGTELFLSGYYNSILPAYLRTNVRPENSTFLMLVIPYKYIDWEKRGDSYVASFDLRISFQNKKTHQLTEFYTQFETKPISQQDFDDRDQAGSLVVRPVTLHYWDGEKFAATLGDTIKQLEAGDYVMNVRLWRRFTEKYNSWR